MYDIDRKSNERDFIGQMETTLSRIMSSKGLTYINKLILPKSEVAERGKIIVRADVITKSNDDLFLRVKATLYPFTSMGCCNGTNNPYYVLSRGRPENTKEFVRVHQSDAVLDNPSP